MSQSDADSVRRPMIIGVGQPHPMWPFLPQREGMQAVYVPDALNLVITMDCTPAEIRSFQQDGMKFGLLKMNGGYCWLLRTSFTTLEAPYSPCIDAPEVQAGPWHGNPITENTRLQVSLHVIDLRGIARALKLVTVSPDFTRKLMSMHGVALKTETAMAAWNAEVDGHMRRYPDIRKAFEFASVTCKGGD